MILDKLKTTYTEAAGTVSYTLGDIPLDSLIGKPIRLIWDGNLQCHGCKKSVKKLLQGHCYPCSQRLASQDLCAVKPETCHYFAKTCREPAWGEARCFIPHTIYLAYTSHLKVGITRSQQKFHRWMDQGAHLAVSLGETKSRYEAGLIEVALKEQVSDRTSWQKMLQEPKAFEGDLREEGRRLLTSLPRGVFFTEDLSTVYSFSYPVLRYPEGIKSLELIKDTPLEGVLLGAKGQYLIFDHGVFSVRKYSGYSLLLL